ncbi:MULTISPECIES: putative holin-like toxin [Streptococcus]|nr:putative holin-like toxin [Streptococcus parauberis]
MSVFQALMLMINFGILLLTIVSKRK